MLEVCTFVRLKLPINPVALLGAAVGYLVKNRQGENIQPAREVRMVEISMVGMCGCCTLWIWNVGQVVIDAGIGCWQYTLNGTWTILLQQQALHAVNGNFAIYSSSCLLSNQTDCYVRLG